MGTNISLYESVLFNVKSKVKLLELLMLLGKLSPHWLGQLSICGEEVEPVSGYLWFLETASALQRPGFEFCPQLILCETVDRFLLCFDFLTQAPVSQAWELIKQQVCVCLFRTILPSEPLAWMESDLRKSLPGWSGRGVESSLQRP